MDRHPPFCYSMAERGPWAAPTGPSKPPAVSPPWAWWPSRSTIVSPKAVITPIEAVDDTRAAFRWVRRHALEFHIDPKRVAGYGVSAGGQLVAVAAMVEAPDDGIEDTSSKPNLLLLWSPAVFAPKHLFQGRGNASNHSPMQHAGAATPPTCIVNGDKDTVTPIRDAQDFRERVVRAGGVCELHVYPGVGHLLTRNVANQLSDFDPDPAFRADGYAQFERFLRERGYLPRR